MSEARFTRAIWRCCNGAIVGCPDILFVDATNNNGDKLGVICRLTRVVDKSNVSDEDIANTHLIAAAPEMYEMLDKLSPMLTDANYHTLAAEIDQLLAKARGES